MKFLCLCHYDDTKFKAMTPKQFEEFVAVCKRHDAEFMASGHVVWVGSLPVAGSVKTLKVTAEEPSKLKIEDGLYHQTNEPFGAAFLLDCKDIDEAMRVARLHPGTHLGHFMSGGIEIRPFEHFAEGKLEKAA